MWCQSGLPRARILQIKVIGGCMACKERTLDLFAEHSDVDPLIDNLSLIPADEQDKIWGHTLRDLLAVMISEMKRAGLPDSQVYELASKLTLAIAIYMGGQQIYLPAGNRLKIAIRDTLIYAEFNGRNLKHLCKKYRLAQTALYGVLKSQRTAYVRRKQYNLL
jgi:Mor family transcriptional regulator